MPISARCFASAARAADEFFQAGIEDLGDTDTARADARSRGRRARAAADSSLPGAGPDGHARRPGDFRGGAGGAWPAARLAHAARPRLRLGLTCLTAALADLANPPRTGALAEHGGGTGGRRRSNRLSRPISRRAWKTAGLSAVGGPHARRKSRAAWSKRPSCAACASRPEAFDGAESVPRHPRAARQRRGALGGLRQTAPACRSAARSTICRARRGNRRARLAAGTIHYDAAFGRPLDYYTGLVFEIAASGRRRGRWPAAAATTGC